MRTHRNIWTLPFGLIVAACLILSACTPKPTAVPTQTPVPTVPPTPTAVSLPELIIEPGENYFSLEGQPSFILSRNITGKTQDDFGTLLEYAHQGGTKLIRLHLTHGWWGNPWINTNWSVDEKWARQWDGFFDRAERDGIYVMPVFGVWANWNDVYPADVFHFWQYNPMNVANGGPLESPTGLFQSNSDTQQHWMTWVKTLVERWQGRSNVAAWEIFSEINLASGAPGDTDARGAVSETTAVDFTNTAAAIIRSADTHHRPVTLSLAVGAPFTNEWAKFYELNTLDFIEIHPYSDRLDRELVTDVRQNIIRYKRPVMIGECGLWSTTINANAATGIQHAIWAGLVSGAMNGRALWDNDGYALLSSASQADAMQFLQSYATTELPVARFSDQIDFAGLGPLTSTTTSGIWGAAIGNDQSVIGWYRDAYSEPPDWNLRSVVSQQTAWITVPGPAASWKVYFYSTQDGITILGTVTVSRQGNAIAIPLPDFQDDIAFKASAVR